VARAAPGSLDPQSGRRQATQRIRRQSLEPHVRDPRRLSEEIRRSADRVLAERTTEFTTMSEEKRCSCGTNAVDAQYAALRLAALLLQRARGAW